MKRYAILALVPVVLYLIYDAHFRERTDYNAGFIYSVAVFLVYAAGRLYFGHPIFETNGGAMLAAAAAILLLVYGTQQENYSRDDLLLLMFGGVIGCAGLAIWGMEIKEKEIRERARLLGIEELMFPKEKKER